MDVRTFFFQWNKNKRVVTVTWRRLPLSTWLLSKNSLRKGKNIYKHTQSCIYASGWKKVLAYLVQHLWLFTVQIAYSIELVRTFHRGGRFRQPWMFRFENEGFKRSATSTILQCNSVLALKRLGKNILTYYPFRFTGIRTTNHQLQRDLTCSWRHSKALEHY